MSKGEVRKDGADVIVVGAGAAGCTAALLLSARGHHVVLVDRRGFPRKTASLGWLNARTKDLLAEWKLPTRAILDCPVTDVTFHSADFGKSARPATREVAAYLVDRAALVNYLAEAAKRAGATVRAGSAVSRIRLRETEVAVDLENGAALTARLLILATGYRGELLEQAGFPRVAGSDVVWSATMDLPLPKSARDGARMILVLGVDRRGGMVVFCQSSERMSATLYWYGESTAATAAFQDVCRRAFEKRIVPVDFSASLSDDLLVRHAVAAALDMDTHVSKHCVLIGDAGGFLAAASQEGLYPAMRSAGIAADIVAEALRSRHSQDMLKTFDTAWRVSLADYLRSPHTDPQFLVPLVFSNQPMADRMAAAFFFGENI